MTGKLIWKSESVGGPRTYLSPIIYQYKDFRYILAATGTNLIALEPATGKVAWTFKYWDGAKWDQPGLIWANTPVVRGADIFISMGYDYRNVMLTMSDDGKSVTEKWSNMVLDNHHHGLIELDGNIYGSNWISNSKGKWVCMDWNSGETKYETDWLTKGELVYADGLFLHPGGKKRNNGFGESKSSEFRSHQFLQARRWFGAILVAPFHCKRKTVFAPRRRIICIQYQRLVNLVN